MMKTNPFPSFWESFTMVFRPAQIVPKKYPHKGIADDWKTVGDDLRRAMQRMTDAEGD